MAIPFRIVALIGLWATAKRRLTTSKSDEVKLRVMLVNELFQDPVIGANRAAGLTMTYKLTYSLDKNHDALMGAMALIVTEFPDLNLGNLINWQPSLNVSEYNALPDAARRLLDNVVTIKPAMPTLKLDTEKDADE